MKIKTVLLCILFFVFVLSCCSTGSSLDDLQKEYRFSKEEHPIPYWGTGEYFSFEVFEIVVDRLTIAEPVKLPPSEEFRSSGGIEMNGKRYYQWGNWACPNPDNSSGRYKIEKFVQALDSSGVDAYFGKLVMFFTVREQPDNIENCVALYIFEDDYLTFEQALKEFECTTNHTPYKIGDEISLGPHLREKGELSQPLEVVGICENDVTARFSTGREVEMSWEYFIKKKRSS